MASSLLRKGSRNITYWVDSSKSKKDSRGQSKKKSYMKVV